MGTWLEAIIVVFALICFAIFRCSERLSARQQDREPLSGPEVAQAQMAAFRAWESSTADRFGYLRRIMQPALVVNVVFDRMIAVWDSYFLSEHLPNAVLLTYPDAGHGSLFQFHDSFVRQASLFLDMELREAKGAARPSI